MVTVFWKFIHFMEAQFMCNNKPRMFLSYTALLPGFLFVGTLSAVAADVPSIKKDLDNTKASACAAASTDKAKEEYRKLSLARYRALWAELSAALKDRAATERKLAADPPAGEKAADLIIAAVADETQAATIQAAILRKDECNIPPEPSPKKLPGSS